jgi:rubrerythrin
MLIAELADNDGWLILADMAERLEETDLAASFREALEEEEQHLARLRTWVTADLDTQAGLEPRPVEPVEVPQPPG